MQSPLHIQSLYQSFFAFKKQILAFVILCSSVGICFSFLLPKQYKIQTIIVPANPNLADKNRLFGENIQHLYPFFGNDGDQDNIYGFTQLPWLYDSLVRKYNLIDYYKIKGETIAIKNFKACKKLQNEIEVVKTENNQLIITYWCKDAQLGASVCNNLVEYINNYVQQKWQELYTKTLNNLSEQVKQQTAIYNQFIQTEKEKLEQSRALPMATNKEIMAIVQSYIEPIRRIEELKVAITTTPNALYVVQPATPTALAEKPNKLLWIITTFVVSLFFSLCVAFVVYKPTNNVV
jgi:LPS O-antigen subunit length determinant protein (WzzB/FepE family)